MSDEQFTLFWDGPFSQWTESDFTLDEVDYGCCEQWMMASKARMFGDEQTCDMIMESDDPAQQKKLGRLIESFVLGLWQEREENDRPRCWNVVWRGNMAKFSQNPGLLEELLNTKGTTLVEASPFDKIWGIGLGEDAPGARYRAAWNGYNWLGEVLTNVREHLAVDPTPYESTDDPRNP